MSASAKVANGLDQIAPLLVCEKTAAKLIGVSPATLTQARFRRKPILPFLRVGRRLIRYRVSDIHAYVKGNIDCAAD
jgi:DNA-binding transcriptional regulator YdaS (Cro superfamily)